MGQENPAGSGMTVLQIAALLERLQQDRGGAPAGSGGSSSGAVGCGYGLDLIWEDE